MRLRESGMPEEAYWETLFDVPLILDRLGIDARLKNVVELGCGSELLTPKVMPPSLRRGSPSGTTRVTGGRQLPEELARKNKGQRLLEGAGVQLECQFVHFDAADNGAGGAVCNFSGPLGSVSSRNDLAWSVV